MYLQRCIAGSLWAAVLAVPAGAFASEPEQWEYLNNCGGEALAGAAGGAGAAAAPRTAAAGFGQAAAAAQLDGARGRNGGIASDTRLTGAVSGNAAANIATGANVIQSGSFANASGIPIVIQNSGANVLIQNATVVNLQLK
jgi:hypothetical protein